MRCVTARPGCTPAFTSIDFRDALVRRRARRRAATAAATGAPRDASRGRARFRILVATGDVSGDAHAANLACELARRGCEVVGVGGSRLEAAVGGAGQMLANNAGMSSIGLLEALPLVVPTLVQQARVKREARERPLDAAVLVDYPGANLPLGGWLRRRAGWAPFPIVYYIPPNEWLWNRGRTPGLLRLCDAVLCAYSGEQAYYAGEASALGMRADKVAWVGHPVLDELHRAGFSADPEAKRAAKRVLVGGASASSTSSDDPVVVALCPGSRAQELRLILPVLCRVAAQVARELEGRGRAVRFVLPLPRAVSDLAPLVNLCLDSSGLSEQTTVWEGDSRAALCGADIALAKSGTVNLELALLRVPHLACYRVSPLSARVGRAMGMQPRFISLVNVILDEAVVPEFVQEGMDDEDAMRDAALQLLDHPEDILEGFSRLAAHVGAPGAASRAADAVISALEAQQA